jgi:hypothetical protein
MLDSEKILNWIIIIAALVLVVMLFVLPKDHCDTCNFDGQNGKEWFNDYSSKCLRKYSYGQENPNLPNLQHLSFP